MFPPEMIKLNYRYSQSKILDEKGQQMVPPSMREEDKESMKVEAAKYYSTGDHRAYSRDPSNE